ncbi:serine hydrolase [bacterium]|nr:serine hydrolase [bacterium]
MFHRISCGRRRGGHRIALLMILLATTALGAGSLDQRLPRLMRLGDVPGLSLAMVRGDSITWSTARGVRDARTRGPVDGETVFEAASLSKTVFAYLTLRLVDRGVIDLDTPLVRYVRYDRLVGDPRHGRVTARMCLSHTTGLPNWGTRFVAEPGTRFTYSGEGIRYLRKALEAVTGRTLEQLARREVFEPLGMSRSSYLWRPRFAGNRATGHDRQGRPQPRRRCPDGSAAASLHTTATDYARFLRACLAGEGLSDASHRQLLEPEVRADLGGPAAARSHLGWSLGWGTMDGPDGPLIWQWGDNGDTVALAVADPSTDEGLIYFANSATALSIAHELMAEITPARPWNLEALGYERYDSPQRVARFEQLARRALQRREWTRAGTILQDLLAMRPDHDWAAARLHQLQRWLAEQKRRDDGRG